MLSPEIQAAVDGGYITQAQAELQNNPNYEIAPPGDNLVMSLEDTKALKLPPIESVCGPLTTASVFMIAGVSGIGKSLFTLHMAAHISCGMDMDEWKVRKARRVLYVDGEMAVQYLLNRLDQLPHGANLDFIHLESMRQAGHFPDMAQQRWRDWFVDLLQDYDVVIFDTVSSLIMENPETKAYDPRYWLQLEEFHKLTRSEGKTVIWCDNLNKNGEVFGTSTKHHKVDAMWMFTRWKNCPMINSACFEMETDKHRGLDQEASGKWYYGINTGWKLEGA